MRRGVNLYIGMILVLSLGGLSAFAEDSVMFPYQGRVKVRGTPFEGPGLFKFAIVTNNGSTTLWSNDGTGAGGGEPAAALTLEVIDGLFSAMIGDTSLGMEALNSSIFNSQTPIKLRTWFSDGLNGFQQLLPDNTIANPELIGVSTGTDDFTIFVDGAAGEDANSGLAPGKAKKTIQAAADVLPERLRANVTIQIAPGVYREQVNIFGISVEPGKKLYVKGDLAWTPASVGDPTVRITGRDNDTSGTAIRLFGIYAQNCTNLEFVGLLGDYASNSSFLINQGNATFRNCKSSHAGSSGIGFFVASSGALYDCVVEHSGEWGIACFTNSFIAVVNCVSRYNEYGVTANTNSAITFDGTGDYSNNAKTGIAIVHLSRGLFHDTYTGQIRNNGEYGIDIRYDSYTEDDTRNTYSNNPLGDTHLQWGGAKYY